MKTIEQKKKKKNKKKKKKLIRKSGRKYNVDVDMGGACCSFIGFIIQYDDRLFILTISLYYIVVNSS